VSAKPWDADGVAAVLAAATTAAGATSFSIVSWRRTFDSAFDSALRGAARVDCAATDAAAIASTAT
jgi:hypothetical protein